MLMDSHSRTRDRLDSFSSWCSVHIGRKSPAQHTRGAAGTAAVGGARSVCGTRPPFPGFPEHEHLSMSGLLWMGMGESAQAGPSFPVARRSVRLSLIHIMIYCKSSYIRLLALRMYHVCRVPRVL